LLFVKRKNSQITVPNDMPFVRSINAWDIDTMKKPLQSDRDKNVIEQNDSRSVLMARLYCLHDEMNATTNELDSYFKCIDDGDSVDNQSFNDDAMCFDGLAVPRLRPKFDMSDIVYDVVSEPNSISIFQNRIGISHN
jgi:hypothetical protein